MKPVMWSTDQYDNFSNQDFIFNVHYDVCILSTVKYDLTIKTYFTFHFIFYKSKTMNTNLFKKPDRIMSLRSDSSTAKSSAKDVSVPCHSRCGTLKNSHYSILYFIAEDIHLIAYIQYNIEI